MGGQSVIAIWKRAALYSQFGTVKNRNLPAIVVAATTSALIWALSPLITGHREPWDAAWPFYWLALLIGGAISGAVIPKPLRAHYLGSLMGQLAYEVVFLRVGGLFLLGAVLLLGYCLIFLVGAGVAGFFRFKLRGAESS